MTTVYNEEVKKQFIEERCKREDEKRKFISFFGKTEAIEFELQKDLFSIPRSVLAEYILKKQNIHSLATMTTYMSMTKKYMLWANDKNLSSEEDKYLPFEELNLSNIFLKYNEVELISSPEELIKKIKKKMNIDVDRTYVDIELLSAAYMCLIYQGISVEEVFSINLSDVEQKKNEILIKTKEHFILIYPEFYEIINFIISIRSFQNLKTKNRTQMGRRLLDNGCGLSDVKLKKQIAAVCSDSGIMESGFRTEDLFVMGMIYKNIPRKAKSKKDILVDCYGSSYTSQQRTRVYQLYDKYTTL